MQTCRPGKPSRNVFTPYAELYHYESQTRGLEDTRKKKRRFAREAAFIKKKWGDLLTRDAYYNPNLETDPPGKSFDRKLDRIPRTEPQQLRRAACED